MLSVNSWKTLLQRKWKASCPYAIDRARVPAGGVFKIKVYGKMSNVLESLKSLWGLIYLLFELENFGMSTSTRPRKGPNPNKEPDYEHTQGCKWNKSNSHYVVDVVQLQVEIKTNKKRMNFHLT